MPPLLVYAPRDSPRLRYILDWMLGTVLGQPYILSHDTAAPAQLSYGAVHSGAVCIPDGGLLWQQGVTDFALPGTFQVRDGIFNGDILSAAFFLLSRMEEWGPFEPDRHGRFPAAASVLARLGLLQQPVVDEWVEALRTALNEAGGVLPKPVFAFRPTYDIDIAWAYHHKGWKRSVGGALRDLRQGAFGAVRQRLRVLQGMDADPYEAYRFLRRLHAEHGLKPHYFILAAAQPGPHDKNADPGHPAMRALVQDFALEGTVGIHPSYNSSEQPGLVESEKAWLENRIGQPIVHSRQHYIRLRLPHTYRVLLANGIREDWSMGYPDAIGFRAGTGRSFSWYDLEGETVAPLQVHPFVFMDVTARDYSGLSAEAAFTALRELRETLRRTGSTLTTVFHNFSLGTAPDWPNWREAYEQFLTETHQHPQAT